MTSNGPTVLDLGPLEWRSKQSSKWTYRLGNCTIELQKQPVIFIALFIGLCLLSYFKLSGGVLKSDFDHDFNHVKPISSKPFYNSTYPLTQLTITPLGLKYRIAVIADLDTDSKVKDKSNQWESFLKLGDLTWDDKSEAITIDWDPEPLELKSSLSTGGRGMELSELAVFNGHLYTVDDRTGVVYRLEAHKGIYKVVPWVILADGNGQETKGFKCEWMTVKDEHLYIGGLGKEWTTQDGTVLNFNPMFVKRISMEGVVEHVDWYDNYLALRSKAGIEFPGYMIHEAAMWSNVYHQWTFLPRRASKKKYNDAEDETHGTNMMLEASANFNQIELKTVGDLSKPSHGFSSLKFLPETQDSVIVALKSEEVQGKVATYIMVFKRDGTILYPETYIGDHKYEGIEFV